MTATISVLYLVTMFFVFASAAGATLFPILYHFSTRWHENMLGRALMTQAIALALALDGTIIFQLWAPENLLLVVIANMFVFILLTVAVWFMTYKLYKHNILLPKIRKKANSE